MVARRAALGMAVLASAELTDDTMLLNLQGSRASVVLDEDLVVDAGFSVESQEEVLVDAELDAEADRAALATVQNVLSALAEGGGPRKAARLLEQLASTSVTSMKVIDPVTKMALEMMHKTLVEVSENVIVQNHEHDQSFLYEHAKTVQGCSDSYDNGMEQVATIKSTVDDKEHAHKVCRGDLGSLIQAANSTDKCKELDTWVKNLEAPSCHAPTKNVTALDDYFRSVDSYVNTHWPKFQELNSACHDRDAERAEKDGVCCSKQNAFETYYCAWRMDVFETCSLYYSCYERAKHDYEASREHVRINEKDRKIDWVATSKIKCYIDVMLSDDRRKSVREQKFHTCQDEEPNTDHLNITMPPMAPRRTCDLAEAAVTPCTAAFNDRYYADCPDSGECTCQACTPLFPSMLRHEDMCVENMRIDEASLEGDWSTTKYKYWYGKVMHGPFVPEVASKSVYLSHGGRYTLHVLLDTYGVTNDAACKIAVNNVTLEVPTPVSECSNGWEAAWVDYDGQHVFGEVGAVNCVKEVVIPNILSPEDGILKMDISCPLQADAGTWGFHGLYFDVDSCPHPEAPAEEGNATAEEGNATHSATEAPTAAEE